MKFNKRKITIWLGFIISAIFLYLALRKTEWVQVISIFKETNYLFLIPAVIAFFADFSFRALRWKFLLIHIKNCRYPNLLSSVFIGFFSNTIFPMRAGEFIRSYFIGVQEDISKVSAFGTIAVERVFDGITVVGLLIFALFFFPITPEIQKILFVAVFFFAGALLVMYGLLFFRNFTRNLLKKIFRLLPEKIAHIGLRTLDSFTDGLMGIKSKQIIPIILLSIVAWTLNASMFFFTGLGMGFDITFPGAIFLTTIIALGVAIPSSPGHVGVFEFFGIMAAGVIGIPKSEAVAFILLGRFLHTITILSAGGFFMAKEQLSLAQLNQQREEETQ